MATQTEVKTLTTKVTVTGYVHDGWGNSATVTIKVPSDGAGVIITSADDGGAWVTAFTMDDCEAKAWRDALVSHYGEGS